MLVIRRTIDLAIILVSLMKFKKESSDILQVFFHVLPLQSESNVGARKDYSYRASKAGLNQLTRMLGRDLARDNINVNAISPGFFKSNLTSFMFDNEALYERFKKTNPVPREGRPEEVAGLAIYLASRAGNYMTGSIVDIDGGLSFIS